MTQNMRPRVSEPQASEVIMRDYWQQHEESNNPLCSERKGLCFLKKEKKKKKIEFKTLTSPHTFSLFYIHKCYINFLFHYKHSQR